MESITYRYPDYPGLDCVYCGETAESKDHLLPKGFTGEAQRKIVPVVPSCQECNSTLGAVYMPDVLERREYIQTIYRKKYKKYLKRVVWGESDLEEFGPTLRAAIEQGIIEHHKIIRRLAWPEDPLYDHKAWSSCWDEEIE